MQHLAARGFRPTVQREHVYAVLLHGRDHPTAEQVFLRAKKGMPDISMATVYNCLDALVKSGLVKEVILARAALRYCANMREHCHFYCTACGEVFDIECDQAVSHTAFHLPQGFHPELFELLIQGTCSTCSEKHKESGSLAYEHSH